MDTNNHYGTLVFNHSSMDQHFWHDLWILLVSLSASRNSLVFLPFVPDSPTASLFFVFVIIGFLTKIQQGWIEALAVATLFKYGIWAVGMNLGGAFVGTPLDFVNYMLIFSHLGMAVQGLLYAPFYKIKGWHIVLAAFVLFHNEIIDYVFDMMPRYPVLSPYQNTIGYLTFWLSALSVFILWKIRRP